MVLNVDDSVNVDWWSTFANTLMIQCYERGDIEAGQGESAIHHSLSYHRNFANIESSLQLRYQSERNQRMVANLPVPTIR